LQTVAEVEVALGRLEQPARAVLLDRLVLLAAKVQRVTLERPDLRDQLATVGRLETLALLDTLGIPGLGDPQADLLDRPATPDTPAQILASPEIPVRLVTQVTRDPQARAQLDPLDQLAILARPGRG
jgi:hypothetical protein